MNNSLTVVRYTDTYIHRLWQSLIKDQTTIYHNSRPLYFAQTFKLINENWLKGNKENLGHTNQIRKLQVHIFI